MIQPAADIQTKKPLHPIAGYLGIFFFVLALYVLTLAPDLVWQDQGDYQLQAARLSLSRPGDVVRVHPLYIVTAHLLGRVTPLSFAYAANLTSALCAAFAAANLYLIVRLLTRSLWPALFAGIFVSLTHTFWFIGVQAQTYTMACALLTGGLVFVLLYHLGNRIEYLLGMAVLFGLGFSTHMMTQIGFAVIMLWLLAKVIKKQFSLGILILLYAAWALSAGLQWYAVWLEYRRTGDFFASLLSAVYGKWGDAVFNLANLPGLVKRSIMFFVLNFPTPLVLLAPYGLWLSFRKGFDPVLARLLAALTLIYTLFAVRYDVNNMNHFFLPFYLLIIVYAALGLDALIRRYKTFPAAVSLLLLLMMPPTYILLAHVAKSRGIALGTRRHIPYRDVYTYYLIPWQQDQTGPRRMVTESFDRLPPGAVLMPDSTTIPPFEYAQEIEGLRPDLHILGLGEMSLMEIRQRFPGARLFTVSDHPSYRPSWVKDAWLNPFPISDTEALYEIVPDGTGRNPQEAGS